MAVIGVARFISCFLAKLLALRQHILLLYDRWHNASAVTASKRRREACREVNVATLTSGPKFRNTEFFRMKGGNITEIEIYFGARVGTVGGKE